MKKPINIFKAIIIFIVFSLILPTMMFIGSRKIIKYMIFGTPVDCTVQTVIDGSRNPKTAYYVDENGSVIIANVNLNFSKIIYPTFKGKVLPEYPNEVYVSPPSKLTMIVALAFVTFFCLGISILRSGVLGNKMYKLLKNQGMTCQGRVVSVREQNNCFHARILFTCGNGFEYDKEFYVGNQEPNQGDVFNVIYYIKQNGKCYAQILHNE